SVNAAGEVSYKNMVYTEYFARGTEPTRTCTVHSAAAAPYPEPYFAVGDIDTLRDSLSPGAVGTSSAPDGGASPSPAPASPEPLPSPHESAPAAAAPRQPAPSQPSDQAPVPLPAAPPEAPPPPTQ